MDLIHPYTERDMDAEEAVVRQKNLAALAQAKTELKVQPPIFDVDNDDEFDHLLNPDEIEGGDQPRFKHTHHKKQAALPPGMRGLGRFPVLALGTCPTALSSTAPPPPPPSCTAPLLFSAGTFAALPCSRRVTCFDSPARAQSFLARALFAAAAPPPHHTHAAMAAATQSATSPTASADWLAPSRALW